MNDSFSSIYIRHSIYKIKDGNSCSDNKLYYTIC